MLSVVRSILGHFTSWISLLLRPQNQMVQLWSQSGVEINQSAQRKSLLTPERHRWCNRRYLRISFVYLWISERWFSFIKTKSLLTYLVHAKSTGELISFGFSDRSVRSLVSAIRWVQS